MKAKVPVVLAGFGNVGRAFARLVRDKEADLRGRYGLELEVRAVLRRSGGWLLDGGSELDALLAAGPFGGERLPTWRPGLSFLALSSESCAGILADATPSDFRTGEPGLSLIRGALAAGWDVVAAAKGALVVDFAALTGAAAAAGRALRFSGATAAALPTLDVATVSLAGAEIRKIDGILTGTTNYILGRIEEGLTFEAGLAEAQAKGIAEPDPSLDVDGWDTAAKIILLVNAALGAGLRLSDVAREGIRGVTPEALKDARRRGKVLKLLGRFVREGSVLRAEVRPTEIEAAHPLFRVVGTDKGVSFYTDTMGAITVTGGKSDPRGTAAAMLKDVINIRR